MKNGSITALEAQNVLKNLVKELEKSGNHDGCLDLLRVMGFVAPLSQKEFSDIPLAGKCEYWRKQGKPEGFIVNLCVDMLNAALGDGWRDDPAIKTAMTHPKPTDLL